jgi:CcmD family protein
MKKMYSALLCFCLIIISAVAYAQSGMNEDEKVQMADGMRSSGKIYVVVAVVLIILAGLIVYLVQLDRKLRKLEKELR